MSNMVTTSSEASESATSSTSPPTLLPLAPPRAPATEATHGISLHVREATPSKDDLEDELEDDLDEDIDADDESSTFSFSTPSMMAPKGLASYSGTSALGIRWPRDRSHSTVSNSYISSSNIPSPGSSPSSSTVAAVVQSRPDAIAQQQEGSVSPPPPEQTSSSAVLPMPTVNLPHHLDLLIEPAVKRRSERRSVSTIGPLSISPPTKTPRSGELEDLNLRSGSSQYYGYGSHGHYHSHYSHRPSSAFVDNYTYTKPPIAGSTSSTATTNPRESRHYSMSSHRHGGGGGGGVGSGSQSVRFRTGAEDRNLRYPYNDLIAASSVVGGGGVSDRPRRTGSVLGIPSTRDSSTSGGNPPEGFRCHHMIAEENHDPAWSGVGDNPDAAAAGGGGAGVPSPSSSISQHVVQRTQSNPEMECCPVCLARNQCEILLKRTYSKVNRGIFVNIDVNR